MSEAVHSNKKSIMEEKIEQFCETASELLTGIHERCSSKEEGKKSGKRKRGRKKKQG